MKLILEFDDYGQHNCDKELDYFIDRYPRIVFNMFTVPIYTNRIKDKFKSGNIRHAYHGYNHTELEFKSLSFSESMLRLQLAQERFREAGIDAMKIFRAPYWSLNQAVLEALVACKFTHVYTHTDFSHLNYDGIKPVYYNWNLKDDMSFDSLKDSQVIGHGHTHDVCGNGLPEISKRLDIFLGKYYDQIEFLSLDQVSS